MLVFKSSNKSTGSYTTICYFLKIEIAWITVYLKSWIWLSELQRSIMRQKQSKFAHQRDNSLIVKLSDGYTTDDITYQWDSDDPLQLSNNLDLPRFAVFTCLILTKIWAVPHVVDYKQTPGSTLSTTQAATAMWKPTQVLQRSETKMDGLPILSLRRVQLLVRGPCVQAPVLLLPHHHLRPWLHARHCILGLSLHYL